MGEHRIMWVEIPAQSPEEAGKFYSELFGWEMQKYPDMNYVTFGDEKMGGGFPKANDDTYKPGKVLVYVGTDDIEASLARAESLGGRTKMTKQEIPGMGWWATFEDPTGNVIALFKGQPG